MLVQGTVRCKLLMAISQGVNLSSVPLLYMSVVLFARHTTRDSVADQLGAAAFLIQQ